MDKYQEAQVIKLIKNYKGYKSQQSKMAICRLAAGTFDVPLEEVIKIHNRLEAEK